MYMGKFSMTNFFDSFFSMKNILEELASQFSFTKENFSYHRFTHEDELAKNACQIFVKN